MNLSTYLSKLKAIADAATPGSWYVAEVWRQPPELPQQFVRSNEEVPNRRTDHAICEARGGTGPRPLDAQFIATSRSAIPLLIAIVEEQHRALERCVRAADRYHEGVLSGWLILSPIDVATIAVESLARVEAMLGNITNHDLK